MANIMTCETKFNFTFDPDETRKAVIEEMINDHMYQLMSDLIDSGHVAFTNPDEPENSVDYKISYEDFE